MALSRFGGSLEGCSWCWRVVGEAELDSRLVWDDGGVDGGQRLPWKRKCYGGKFTARTMES